MTDKNENKDEKNPSEMQKIASSYSSGWAYAEYAFQYAAAIVVCSLLGYWLDNVLKTGNILLIVGVFVGAVAGFIGMLKSLKVLGSKNKDLRFRGEGKEDEKK